MRDLICDVISGCVWSWDTGKIDTMYMIKPCLKPEKKKMWKSSNFLHLKDGLGIPFIACWDEPDKPEEVLTSFTYRRTRIIQLYVQFLPILA